MPIFEKNGKYVLFAHIPKAGGTTIEHLFLRDGWHVHLFDGGEGKSSLNGVLNCSPQHWHANILEKICNDKKFIFSFCIIRHPISRMLSEVKWRRKYFKIPLSTDDWINQALDGYLQNSFIHDNHIRPQCDFILNRMSVFKMENGFPEILSAVAKSVGDLELDPLYRAMKSDEDKSVDERMSGETQDRLLEFYKSDCELWSSK